MCGGDCGLMGKGNIERGRTLNSRMVDLVSNLVGHFPSEVVEGSESLLRVVLASDIPRRCKTV